MELCLTNDQLEKVQSRLGAVSVYLEAKVVNERALADKLEEAEQGCEKKDDLVKKLQIELNKVKEEATHIQGSLE